MSARAQGPSSSAFLRGARALLHPWRGRQTIGRSKAREGRPSLDRARLSRRGLAKSIDQNGERKQKEFEAKKVGWRLDIPAMISARLTRRHSGMVRRTRPQGCN